MAILDYHLPPRSHFRLHMTNWGVRYTARALACVCINLACTWAGVEVYCSMQSLLSYMGDLRVILTCGVRAVGMSDARRVVDSPGQRWQTVVSVRRRIDDGILAQR